MSTQFMQIHKPGLGNASSFQVSGRPFVTGALNVPATGSSPIQLGFDSVTKKIIILNRGNHDLRLGFSSTGITGTNYVIINKKDGAIHGKLDLEVKCTSIFLLGEGITTADVVAELTNIPASELSNNWSGSSGVG